MGELRGYDRYLAYINYLSSKINLHLPKSRKSLLQLLDEKEPYVETLDESKIYFKKQDLEEASKLIPRHLHDSAMLPVILLRRIGLGKGVFTVAGGEAEKLLVKNALGMTEKPYEKEMGEEESYLYRVQIQELLNRLGSLVVIGFDVPPEKEHVR